MTAADELRGHIDHAGGHVLSALKSWDAGSLAGCDDCCELLRGAIADMECAWRAAENGAPASIPTRQRLYQLRADIHLMVRLVDASTAFCRGMALRIGASGNEVSAQPQAAPSSWAPREA